MGTNWKLGGRSARSALRLPGVRRVHPGLGGRFPPSSRGSSNPHDTFGLGRTGQLMMVEVIDIQQLDYAIEHGSIMIVNSTFSETSFFIWTPSLHGK